MNIVTNGSADYCTSLAYLRNDFISSYVCITTQLSIYISDDLPGNLFRTDRHDKTGLVCT